MKNNRLILAGTLFSNLVGAFVIFCYFAYVDLETFRSNRLFWRGTQADWTTFAAVMIVLGLAGWFIISRVAGPLEDWARRIRTGGSAEAMPEALQRRALTLPLFVALVSLGLGVIVGLFFAQGGLRFGSTDAATFWRTYLGTAVIGGVLNSALAFLIVDNLWRARLPHRPHAAATAPTPGPRHPARRARRLERAGPGRLERRTRRLDRRLQRHGDRIESSPTDARPVWPLREPGDRRAGVERWRNAGRDERAGHRFCVSAARSRSDRAGGASDWRQPADATSYRGHRREYACRPARLALGGRYGGV